MQRLKNSYWFSHGAYHSKAKIHYGNVYKLPAELGMFDIALMGSVLLHGRDPLTVVEECAKKAGLLIIADMLYAELESAPLCRFAPNSTNFL